MRTVTVYRVDYVRKTREAIGEIVERREAVRERSFLGMLLLARRLYATDPEDAIHIALDGRDVGASTV